VKPAEPAPRPFSYGLGKAVAIGQRVARLYPNVYRKANRVSDARAISFGLGDGPNGALAAQSALGPQIPGLVPMGLTKGQRPGWQSGIQTIFHARKGTTDTRKWPTGSLPGSLGCGLGAIFRTRRYATYAARHLTHWQFCATISPPLAHRSSEMLPGCSHQQPSPACSHAESVLFASRPHLDWSWCGFYFASYFYANGKASALHAAAGTTAPT
jgi:hypothetical protein